MNCITDQWHTMTILCFGSDLTNWSINIEHMNINNEMKCELTVDSQKTKPYLPGQESKSQILKFGFWNVTPYCKEFKLLKIIN